jgi:acyl-CoA dehydrogenase
MDFDHTPKVRALQERLRAFMERHVYPNERRYEEELAAGERWQPLRLIEELKAKARASGLWNLFLPGAAGADLTNLEYAPLCEIMGRVDWAPEVFNCSAPDTGNMEVLEHYGSEAQKKAWLEPLLEGRIRSAFAMTEPGVASSDATNIECRIERRGAEYVINGHKWWASGSPDRRCRLLIVMGKTDPGNPDRHRQQSMILVPMDTPGVKLVGWRPVLGYDHAPHGHGEIVFEDARVPAANLLLGEGRGFEIAQGRLGPGRIHHCMRIVGQAEVALEKMCRRTLARVAFGRPIAEQTVTMERIAEARIAIDQARLLVLKAADRMDKVGNKAAAAEIAMIKVAAPNMLCRVLDWAMQAHGAAGVTDESGLPQAYAWARAMRIIDGPDEVHRNQVARLELRRYREAAAPARAAA